MKINQTERDKVRTELLKKLKPGDTVYTVLRHVSRSGMMRRISALTIKSVRGQEPEIRQYEHELDILCGFKMGEPEGNIIGGCGMDIGFSLVQQLSRALWPNGFTCAGDRCRSNEHMNGDRNRKPHHHRDGGYALIQRWL